MSTYKRLLIHTYQIDHIIKVKFNKMLLRNEHAEDIANLT